MTKREFLDEHEADIRKWIAKHYEDHCVPAEGDDEHLWEVIINDSALYEFALDEDCDPYLTN